MEVYCFNFGEEVCLLYNKAFNVARIDFNGLSDLADYILDSFVFSFNCNYNPVIKNIEDFVCVGLHFLE